MIRPSLRNSFGGGIPLLFALYMLQGLPFGLVSGSLPLILSKSADSSSTDQSSGGDYRGASWLAMAVLPYGFKLLWGPFVDTHFSKAIGRRKSWIIPCNLITSFLWLELSLSIDHLVLQITETQTDTSDLITLSLFNLTCRLFLITLIMAISDVAVDGWALTVENRLFSQASLAQTLGMTFGNFITNAGVICSKTKQCYEIVFQVNQPISLYNFCIFAALLHFSVTILIILFISEDQLDSGINNTMTTQKHFKHKHSDTDLINLEQNAIMNENNMTVKQIINLIWLMSKRKHCRILAWLLVTSKFAFALSENGVLPSVEYMSAGGDMDKLAVVVAFQYPIQGLIGLYVARHLGRAKADPLNLWKNTHIVLLVLSGSIPFIMKIVASFVSSSSSNSIKNHEEIISEEEVATDEMNHWIGAILLGFILAINNVANKVCFIAMGTWFNIITDETAGGTIITLLNSLCNMGRFFPRSPAFWLADNIGASYAVGLLTIGGIIQFPYVSSWMQELKKVDKRDWLLHS